MITEGVNKENIFKIITLKTEIKKKHKYDNHKLFKTKSYNINYLYTAIINKFHNSVTSFRTVAIDYNACTAKSTIIFLMFELNCIMLYYAMIFL